MNRRLTREEEPDLWRRKEQGCEKARTRLIEGYSFLAVLTVRKAVPHIPERIEYEDLCQEANLALVRAVDQYQPGRGTKFTSYAITLMRCACLEYLRREDWVPRSVRDLAKQIERAETTAQAEHPDRPVTEAEIALILGWGEDWLASRRQTAAPVAVLSLSDILWDRDRERSNDALTVIDRLVDKEADVEAACFVQARLRALGTALSYLPPEEREVLESRYVWQETGAVFGARIGRSQARIQQRHDQAIRRLRYLLRSPASGWIADGP